ncbi:MAG: outer membrane beta-barrel protein [Cyclobacteriaceae bacterium]
MKKLTDQELDSLFKAASDGYQPAFDAAGWEAMADKLNQPKLSIWKKWMPYALVGLIIFSSGVWVGTTLNQDQVESRDDESRQEKDLSLENQRQQPIANQRKGDEIKIGESKHNNERVIGNVNQNNLAANKEIASHTILDTEIDDDDRNPDSEKRILPEQLQADEFKILAKENPIDSTLHTNEKTKTDTTTLIAEEQERKKDHRSSHSIFLRALASPDFSTINFSSASSVGSNYAFLLEYQINPRLTISTGAIRSMKKYTTSEEITYSGYTADQLDGACRIIDIPLNVYYNFPSQSRISFYAGVGLSSYIMQQENYTYTVNYTYSSRSYSTQVDGKNNEWFKVLNLSAGIQYQMTHRVHLQAEPFVKTSLVGIGEGDVLLNSLGIFFGVKYKIN